MVDAETEILSKEITGEIVLETVDDAEDAVVGIGQGFVMTGACDDDVILRECGNVSGLINGFFELGHTLTMLGADVEWGMR